VLVGDGRRGNHQAHGYAGDGWWFLGLQHYRADRNARDHACAAKRQKASAQARNVN
jgi:hypothetical protein